MQILYLIKQISKDGLLKDPKNYFDDYIFSIYGYSTRQDALDAINKNGHNYKDYIILEQITKSDD